MHFLFFFVRGLVRPVRRWLASLFWLFASLAGEGAAKAEEPVTFDIAPVPSWVRPLSAESGNPANPDMVAGGIDYLLMDQQENFISRASYCHQVRQVLSDQGVQNGSDITVTFDPSYQKLVFHFIRLIRAGNGAASDRLDRRLFKVLRREKDMEYFLFDGRYTAQCVLEDVRAGDVIEYAFTLEGENPVLAGKKCETLGTMWSVPVGHAAIRLLYPEDQAPRILISKKEITPRITSENGVTEWLWEEREVPPRLLDQMTPPGYNPYGNIQISDFANWHGVVEWALNLFRPVEELSPELRAEIQKLLDIPYADARVAAALRFVQDEIRYLAVSSGIYSHQPNPPGEVLRRRFGDCKDKTRLLATLLDHCGITVAPVLVNSIERGNVADMLPSPYAFDHVILQVTTASDTYWLDATRSDQRGPLDQIYVSNFGCGLVLTPGKQMLTAFKAPASSIPNIDIQESYTIAAPGNASLLDVVSFYRGAAAEAIRANFKRESREVIQKSYLQYYSRRFREINARQPVRLTELPGGAGCKVEEQYAIPEIWQKNDSKAEYSLVIGSVELQNEIGESIALPREDPAGWRYPSKLDHKIQVHLFQDWPIEGSPVHVTTEAFQFAHTTEIEGRSIALKYSYQSLSDTIPVAEVPAHNQALEKVRNALNYTFTHRTGDQAVSAQAGQTFKVNWFLVLCTLVVSGVAIGGCLVLFKRTLRMPPRLCPYEIAHLDGLSGWLVFVGLQFLIRPVMIILALVKLAEFFDQSRWDMLTDPASSLYHSRWLPVLLFEWNYNLANLIFSVLLVVMFFKKRAFFPKGAIIIMVSSWLGLVIDFMMTRELLAAQSPREEIHAAVADILRLTIGGLIWIPYMLVSKRVRATFRH